jgi:tetratricopeptide (TPR) repeat protein
MLPSYKEKMMSEIGVEAISLLGIPLGLPSFPDDIREKLDADVRAAQAAYDAKPDDPDALLLLGQRLGYRGRLRDAIAAFAGGIARFPDDARFYRYRGHRYISVREFANAIADLSEAARITQGQPLMPEHGPNAKPGDRGTSLQFSIYYHLGLAHYLNGDFAGARPAYDACAETVQDDEERVAMTHWRYMTLRRLGDTAAAQAAVAPITRDMNVTENLPYYRLTLLYAGMLTPEAVLAPNPDDPDKGVGNNRALMDATASYGVANWYLYNGQRADAETEFRRIVDGTPPGMARFAFGYIAAEVELARLARQTS